MSLLPLMPYSAVDRDQLDSAWLSAGYGVEAIFFRPPDMHDLKQAEMAFSVLPESVPRTMHFAMSGDYLRDSEVRTSLNRFLKLADRVQARGVTLHANQFVAIENVPTTDFGQQRSDLLRFLSDLYRRNHEAGTWIAVENMPLIGDLADDADAAFVFPSDFDQLVSTGLRITLDTAHLLGAIDTQRATPAVSRAYLARGEELHETSFARHSARIAHLHISIPRGVAIPPHGQFVRGGFVPDQPNDRLLRILQALNPRPPLASLEVEEEDYVNRHNIWLMLAWLQANGIVN